MSWWDDAKDRAEKATGIDVSIGSGQSAAAAAVSPAGALNVTGGVATSEFVRELSGGGDEARAATTKETGGGRPGYTDTSGKRWELDSEGYRLDDNGVRIADGYRVVDGVIREPDYDKETVPSPPSLYGRDADGNTFPIQEWDEELGGYVLVETDHRTPEEVESDQATDELRKNLLGNLSETPAENIIKYQEYGDAITTALHASADPEFARIKKAAKDSYAAYVGDVQARETEVLGRARERANIRGTSGSTAETGERFRITQAATKAITDANTAKANYLADLTTKELNTATQIAAAGVTGARDYETQDRDFWTGLIAQIDAGTNAADILALNEKGVSAGITQGAGNLNLGAAGLAEQIRSNTGNLELAQAGLDFQQERADIADDRYWWETIANTATGGARAVGSFYD